MIPAIQPQTNFPISRIIPDPYDTAAYYVRATVRNGVTGATVATVNLLPLGGGIYSAPFRTPADTSGRGLFLTITTIVYTDSGYTTPSEVYGQDQDTYLIFDSQTGSGGQGGGTSAIDWKAMEALLEAMLKKHRFTAKEIEFPEFPEIPEAADLSSMHAGITDLRDTLDDHLALIRKIADADSKETDLTPVIRALDARFSKLADIIDAIDIPKYEKTDLAPIISGIARVGESVDSIAEIHKPKTAEPVKTAAPAPRKRLVLKRIPQLIKKTNAK